MSYEEKGQWVYVVAIVLTYCAYVAVILGQAGQVPLAELNYVPTMLWAIGIGIGLAIVGRIVIEIARPSDSYDTDERDHTIGRFGEYVAGTVLGIGMVVPFALTLAEFDYFWIGNAIYLAFALSAVVGSVVKVVAYRRGL